MKEKIYELIVYWDYTIWYYLNTQWVNEFLDFIVPFIRNQWTWAPLYLFLLIFMPLNFGRKGWMWLVFFILCFAIGDFVSASIIKPYAMRLRPCNNPYIQDITHLLVHCGSGYSFPSSHATNHFALGIFAAYTIKKKWVWVAGILWALSVGYAQIYVGVHFPFDVICGGILGTIIAIVVGKTYLRIYKGLQTT